jgi:hypothetical protein
LSTASDTTRRSGASVASSMAENTGVIARLSTSGVSLKAPAISSRNRDRMMQPARQILAIVAIGRFHSNSVDAAAITANPWA